jgi:hypothetical protein
MAYKFPQYPLRSGYKRTVPNNLIRSSMDTGPDKVRKRGRGKPHVVTATYVMTSGHLWVFEQFVHNSLAEGAIAFKWPDPERAVAGSADKFVRARLKATNDGLFDVQPYQDTKLWQVTLTLEIWPDVKA